MTAEEFFSIREQFGQSNAKFARAIGISTATLYKLHYDDALRSKYAARIRAALDPIPSPAPVVELHADPDSDALRAYNNLVTAAAALYRIAKGVASTARRSEAARHAVSSPPPLTARARNELRKAISQRNQQRLIQRGRIDTLRALLSAALQQDPTGAAYQRLLASYHTQDGETHLLDFIEAAQTRLVPDNDPLVVLPLEDDRTKELNP